MYNFLVAHHPLIPVAIHGQDEEKAGLDQRLFRLPGIGLPLCGNKTRTNRQNQWQQCFICSVFQSVIKLFIHTTVQNIIVPIGMPYGNLREK